MSRKLKEIKDMVEVRDNVPTTGKEEMERSIRRKVTHVMAEYQIKLRQLNKEGGHARGPRYILEFNKELKKQLASKDKTRTFK